MTSTIMWIVGNHCVLKFGILRPRLKSGFFTIRVVNCRFINLNDISWDSIDFRGNDFFRVKLRCRDLFPDIDQYGPTAQSFLPLGLSPDPYTNDITQRHQSFSMPFFFPSGFFISRITSVHSNSRMNQYFRFVLRIYITPKRAKRECC